MESVPGCVHETASSEEIPDIVMESNDSNDSCEHESDNSCDNSEDYHMSDISFNWTPLKYRLGINFDS